jgi:VIT1/CCC1 family predicted Fe2+/Mn2+ transporter
MGFERSRHAAAHTPTAIRNRLRLGPDHSYLRDFVYGAIDGTVTTFAVVSGVAGAELSIGIILILGLANLVGDGFSMAASNYLATRADEQLRKKARRNEEREIEHYPEGEVEEVRQILRAKGFDGGDLERTVEIITSDRERWVDMMLIEEFGLSLHGPNPFRAAVATFLAFVIVGLIPLLAFILQYLSPDIVVNPFLWSSLLTGATFVGVGAAKARFVEQSWYWSGLETLAVGGSAATLAYLVGALLKGIA